MARAVKAPAPLKSVLWYFEKYSAMSNMSRHTFFEKVIDAYIAAVINNPREHLFGEGDVTTLEEAFCLKERYAAVQRGLMAELLQAFEKSSMSTSAIAEICEGMSLAFTAGLAACVDLDTGKVIDYADPFGTAYEQLELTNVHNGQFFTPLHVCRMMAEMQLDLGEISILSENPLTILDCCCGGGRMFIAAAGVIARKEPLALAMGAVHFTGVDIDLFSVKLCALALWILQIPGRVYHGDSLRSPDFADMKTWIDIPPVIPEFSAAEIREEIRIQKRLIALSHILCTNPDHHHDSTADPLTEQTAPLAEPEPVQPIPALAASPNIPEVISEPPVLQLSLMQVSAEKARAIAAATRPKKAKAARPETEQLNLF